MSGEKSLNVVHHGNYVEISGASNYLVTEQCIPCRPIEKSLDLHPFNICLLTSIGVVPNRLESTGENLFEEMLRITQKICPENFQHYGSYKHIDAWLVFQRDMYSLPFYYDPTRNKIAVVYHNLMLDPPGYQKINPNMRPKECPEISGFLWISREYWEHIEESLGANHSVISLMESKIQNEMAEFLKPECEKGLIVTISE